MVPFEKLSRSVRKLPDRHPGTVFDAVPGVEWSQLSVCFVKNIVSCDKLLPGSSRSGENVCEARDNMDAYDETKVVGRGGFGEAVLCRRKSDAKVIFARDGAHIPVDSTTQFESNNALYFVTRFPSPPRKEYFPSKRVMASCCSTANLPTLQQCLDLALSRPLLFSEMDPSLFCLDSRHAS